MWISRIAEPSLPIGPQAGRSPRELRPRRRRRLCRAVSPPKQPLNPTPAAVPRATRPAHVSGMAASRSPRRAVSRAKCASPSGNATSTEAGCGCLRTTLCVRGSRRSLSAGLSTEDRLLDEIGAAGWSTGCGETRCHCQGAAGHRHCFFHLAAKACGGELVGR